jgi:hypothetical protein
MRRELLWVCGATLALTAGCSSAFHSSPTAPYPPASGVLTGTAGECLPPPYPGRPVHPVQVIVYRSGHVVVKQTKLGTHNFRFTLPPGRYKVKTNQSYAVTVTVTLNAGGTAYANVYSTCA